ncbi:efflux RND transporter periplasmic adaptor subunit [Actinoplanes utahensis]|uniref:Membrane protein n=1 Tax=Actinoplanes utahensis TaxID=1869 RepID=A0A0A6UCQ0_ACTUT|nr:biotin/lipoyl-binding protein [Actinoplanes utahensis]KHD73261.1 membrane protein [Actinoplanes utahensis]GIF27460.1 RND transporter [Actinoplanes utahensis]
MKVRLSRHPSLVVNAVIGVALVAGAATVYETFSSSGGGATAATASERTVTVQQGTVTRTATADGTLESAGTASATFETSGTVTAIHVKVGDQVEKGQALARVDPAAAQRALDAAEADRDAARDALDRAETAGSDTTEAENEVAQAELAVDEAESGMDGTVLTAPMAGTVTAVDGTLGGSASGSSSSSSGASGGSAGSGSGSSSSSSGFIEIADLTRMQVAASFAEADATSLKEKQVATVTWNALSGVSQSARVAAIDPSATTSDSVVTYGVTLTLDKVPAGAKVGQTVSVSVTTGSKENVVLVDAAAITRAGNRRTVTVVANGVRETRAVQIGLEGDAGTEITSGLTAGEQVVVKTTSTSTSGSQQGGGMMGGGGLGGFSGGGGGPGGGGGR